MKTWYEEKLEHYNRCIKDAEEQKLWELAEGFKNCRQLIIECKVLLKADLIKEIKTGDRIFDNRVKELISGVKDFKNFLQADVSGQFCECEIKGRTFGKDGKRLCEECEKESRNHSQNLR